MTATDTNVKLLILIALLGGLGAGLITLPLMGSTTITERYTVSIPIEKTTTITESTTVMTTKLVKSPQISLVTVTRTAIMPITSTLTSTTSFIYTITEPTTLTETFTKTRTIQHTTTTTKIKTTTLRTTRTLRTTETVTEVSMRTTSTIITSTVTTTVTSTYTPTPTQREGTPDVIVISSRGYFVPWYDDYYVVGIARNTGNTSATEIRFTFKFYDKDGTLIGTSTETFWGTLPPNFTLPFGTAIQSDAQARAIDTYHLSLTYKKAVEKPKGLKLVESGFILSERASYADANLWKAVGVIRNEEIIRATNVIVLVAFLNPQGEVVGQGWDRLEPDELDPLEEGVYTVMALIPQEYTVNSVIVFVYSNELSMMEQV